MISRLAITLLSSWLLFPAPLFAADEERLVVLPEEFTLTGPEAVQRLLPGLVRGTQFTGTPGKYVKVADTIKGFKGLVEGEYDDLPEAAFYMVGAMEEAVEKAKKMAAEAA